jgi:hypothetical protein
VPPIVGGPREAVAATWIGIQGPSNAFIQIGTNEQRVAARRGSRASAGYFAFWSDPQHGYHPMRLFAVRPGEQVDASLTLTDGIWHLGLVDEASGRHARFAAASDGSSPSLFALWIQEDAIDASTERRFPYPRMPPTHFAHVLVDSHQPRGRRLESQFMSLPGRYLGPARLAGDAFVVRRMPMSRAAAAYLRIADAGESASEAFLARLRVWSASTPRNEVSHACAMLSHALEHELGALRARRWSRRARHSLAVLTHRLRFLLRRVKSVPAGGALLGWRFDFEGVEIAVAGANRDVQHRLGLPSLKGVIAQ